MNNLNKIKTCVAILLAVAYGLITPYIYYNGTKYRLIKFLISLIVIIYILYKLSIDIKIKQHILSDILLRILAISTYIGIVATFAIEKLR